VNDIESVIVSIRSLLVVGDGRLEAAVKMPLKKREALLAAAENQKKRGSESFTEDQVYYKRKRTLEDADSSSKDNGSIDVGSYSTSEAKSAYSHLSDYHKKKGWSGWWAKRG
jgi:ubiquitin-conjugating enzyme E2 Q